MVKKSDNDWKNYNIQSNSAISVRKYLDLCQSWLIAPQETNSNTQEFFNKKIVCNTSQKAYIGMCEADLRNVVTFKCTICKTDTSMLEDGKSIVANPFTRAQFMLLCHDCHNQITSLK